MNKLGKVCKNYFNSTIYEVKHFKTRKIKIEDQRGIVPAGEYSLIVYIESPLDEISMEKIRGQESVIIDTVKELLNIQQREFLNSVLNVAAYLNSIRDFEELLNRILIEVEKLMNAEASSIFIKSEKDGYLEFFTLRGGHKKLKMIEIPLKGSIAGEVYTSQEIKVDNDVQKSGRYFKKADQISNFVTRSILAAPLIVRNKCIGVIEVLNKKTEHGALFDDFDTEMIKVFAAQAAVALENALLNTEMNEFFIGLIKALSEAIEAKDKYTRGHTDRVSHLSIMIGEKMRLSKERIEILRLASILHDIGKIGIPENILNKPTRLTSEEYIKIKEHPLIGAQILKPIAKLKDVREAVLYHHESYDGYGYPAGLKGEQIPLEARIIAVADTYDALITERPYKKALSPEKALKEIEKCSGTQFDPEVVKVFKKIIKRNEL